MKSTNNNSVFNRNIRTLALVALLVALICSVGCTDITNFFKPSEVYPSINITGSGNYVIIDHAFNFSDKLITLSIPVDESLYYSAYNSDKTAHLYNKTIEDGDWSAKYYLSFVSDEALIPLYDAMLKEFRSLKRNLNLDSDSYAELILTYVQSLDYKTDSVRSEPKFPIETVYEGCGDCDDKSLLAATLLSIEGYDVVLLEFSNDNHMAVGIRLPESDIASKKSFMDTGYLYAETTIPSYIGWKDIQFNNGDVITSAPLIIPVGLGNMTYGSYGEVEKIYSAYSLCRDNINELKPEIKFKEVAIESLNKKLLAEKSRLEEVSRIDPASYNARVAQYNSRVNEYRNEVFALNIMVSKYNEAVNISTYIASNPHDRRGVYEYVMGSLRI